MPENPTLTTDLTSHSGKFVKVKDDETGFEFVTSTPGGGVELGETSSTAYRGDRGKTAYDHSQAAHAPSNAQKNSDITKAEIEAKLTGAITTHTHDYAASDHNHDADYEPLKGADDNYVTDAEKVKLSNLSGTNTGDQDLSNLVVKNVAITGATKTKITYDAKGLVTAGADATTADIADSVDKRYCTDAQKTVIGNTSGTNTGDQTSIAGISGTKAQFDTACSDGNFMYTGDQPTLSQTSAFATATTTVSTATYMDITGCSVSLTAGTWIIFAHVVASAANAIIQCFGAITHNDNTVISESANSRPASGTASLNSPISFSWFAIVSPGSTTTYKLRGARGLTTHTTSWVAMDGTGFNTTNHASNNSDKGTGIFAIRIA